MKHSSRFLDQVERFVSATCNSEIFGDFVSPFLILYFILLSFRVFVGKHGLSLSFSDSSFLITVIPVTRRTGVPFRELVFYDFRGDFSG